jgi:hypothetical protein
MEHWKAILTADFSLGQYCFPVLHNTSYRTQWSAIIVYYYIRVYFTVLFYWPEAIHVTFHFLTYWLAKSNFCAIKNHIALSCKINEWNYCHPLICPIHFPKKRSTFSKNFKISKFQKFHKISKILKNSNF